MGEVEIGFVLTGVGATLTVGAATLIELAFEPVLIVVAALIVVVFVVPVVVAYEGKLKYVPTSAIAVKSPNMVTISGDTYTLSGKDGKELGNDYIKKY